MSPATSAGAYMQCKSLAKTSACGSPNSDKRQETRFAHQRSHLAWLETPIHSAQQIQLVSSFVAVCQAVIEVLDRDAHARRPRRFRPSRIDCCQFDVFHRIVPWCRVIPTMLLRMFYSGNDAAKGLYFFFLISIWIGCR